jgi:hypothetical protein
MIGSNFILSRTVKAPLRKNHVKMELNEPVKSLNCSKHKNEKIKFYCMKYKVDCCSICVISDHHGHKVEENSKLKFETGNESFKVNHK